MERKQKKPSQNMSTRTTTTTSCFIIYQTRVFFIIPQSSIISTEQRNIDNKELTSPQPQAKCHSEMMSFVLFLELEDVLSKKNNTQSFKAGLPSK